ncbi:hypothetical protein [Leifsonia poae]
MTEKLESFNEEIYKLCSENNMPHITEVEALSSMKQREIEEVFQLNG